MLIINDFSCLPTPKTDYEQIVVSFCYDWLNGKKQVEILTSGSTGTPKSIVLTRNQLLASANKTINFLSLKKGDTALVALNVSYIAGMMMLVRAMQVGMKTIVVAPSNNPLLELENNIEIDFAAFVPTQVLGILATKNGQTSFNTIKKVIIGGAAISETLENLLLASSNEVYATYGMTETVSHIAIKKVNGADRNAFFSILSNVSIHTDERSCLAISSDVTQNETIQTNDVVRLIDSKTFEYIGRFDNIINSGGIKIQLEKIEKAVARVLSNKKIEIRFFAFGTKDERLGQKLAIVLEIEIVSKEMLSEIEKDLSLLLTKYELPRKWLFCKQFIETSTQKIDQLNTIKTLPL